MADTSGTGLGDAISNLETGGRIESLDATTDALRSGSLSTQKGVASPLRRDSVATGRTGFAHRATSVAGGKLGPTTKGVGGATSVT
jgi:hypothetical protein